MGRRALLIGFLAIVMVVAYMSGPVLVAWHIREAVRTGDTATLRSKVDWPSVRQSLKSSLGETREALKELAEAAGLPPPTLWQRLKATALPYLADPLIDRYVTAEGAPKLYAWRQTWRRRVEAARNRSDRPGAAETGPEVGRAAAGTGSDRLGGSPLSNSTPAVTFLERQRALLGRVERWGFVSPGRFEIEVQDRTLATRRWFAALELRGLAWQLTEMRVLRTPSPSRGRDEPGKRPDSPTDRRTAQSR